MMGFIRSCGRLLVVVLAIDLAACIPIPIPSLGYLGDSRTNLPDRVPEFVVKGETTREQILFALGAPDSHAADGSWMAYSSARHAGGVAFVVGGGYTAGVVGPVSTYERRLLIVRFDANSVVVDAAVEVRRCLGANDASCSVAPDISEDSRPELSALGTFYVPRTEPDEQDVNQLIVAELRRKGLRASSGPAKEAPAEVDAIFTYRLDWKGVPPTDLSYLAVSVRTPGSDNPLATAGAEQTPRAPKTLADMVAEAVASLFSDSRSTFLTFSPDELRVQPLVAASQGKGTVYIGPVRDARSLARGKVIGERTALGVSLGKIDVSPSPAAIIRELLAAELEKLGYRNTPAGAQIEIDTRLTRFEVETPSTALYWDVNGVIAIDVGIKRDAERQRFHFEATCTDRTFLALSQPLLKGVLSACLTSLGTKIREDHAFAQLLAQDQRLTPAAASTRR